MGRKTRHSAQLKFKAALEAAKEVKTLAELSSQHGVHAAQISQWKKQLLDNGEHLFSSSSKKTDDQQKKIDELHRLLGEMTAERDWYKKKLKIFP
jgi:transposase-like protein